jgi:hypothetical protein
MTTLSLKFPACLSTKRKPLSFAYAFFFSTYAVIALLFLILWVIPSLDGRSTEHLGADSITYIRMAKSIRQGTPDPLTLAALATFPNGLWSPVLIAFLIPNNYVIAGMNCVLFFGTIYLFAKTFEFSHLLFTLLLLVNPTTFTSLLALNKEIIDLFLVALILYAKTKHRSGLLILCILLAAFNRFEVAVAMSLFLFLTSKYNVFKKSRTLSLILLTAAISIFLPLFAGKILSTHMEEASNAGIVALLNSLEANYLYILAVIPKIIQNFIGHLFEVSHWLPTSADEAKLAYMYWLNNVINLFVLLMIAYKKTFSLRSNVVYFALIGSIVMAVSPVIQPRYFYFVYALLCLELSRPLPQGTYALTLPSVSEDRLGKTAAQHQAFD